jgi:hypothetical protein
MTDTAKGEAFVKLPRKLIESAAWRALGINARRFIDFLMIEHMRHGGKANGALLAPREQLERFGIGARHVSAAIKQAENLRLVDCLRGVGRSPSVYALTWLPRVSQGEPQSAEIRVSEGIPLGYPKGSHKARSGIRREVTKPQNKGIRREVPLKKLLTTTEPRLSKDLSGEAQEEAGREKISGGPPSYPGQVTNGSGVTACGKLTEPGKDHRADHEPGKAIH